MYGEFLCPITHDIMRDPVTLADGHSYERESIQNWLASYSTSPATGAPLADRTLTPNHALRNSIDEWLTTQFKLVPRAAINIDDEVIARGSFKTVHRGTLRGHTAPVAVLCMRMSGGSCEEEAAKLVKLGRHKALVRYLGLCTEGPEQLLVTELAPHGSLDVLLEQREEEITMLHKLVMLQQVCSGMVALSSMGLVHRDLAARNLLVFAFEPGDPAATRVKITDFGLAMDRLYQTHAYGVQDEDVPFRWMPPEALKKRRFSEKSDVWAFGVTAWEMLSDGEVPFAFITSNEAVAERVCGGERLARPDGCDDPLWALLLRTWAARPADRPSFTELAGELAHLDVSGLTTAASGVDVSDAAPPPLTWEGVQAQLTQLGYPATACVGCTPIEARNATCFHSMGGRSLLCSVCHHWAGSRLALDDPSATREMLRGKAPPQGESRERRAQGLKPVLDAAFPADAYMSEAHLRHFNNAITRNFARLTPKALADMFDDLDDRSFISAAQAADLLATITACSAFDHREHFGYYHVICHRILDRWNTTADAHGIGDCYHGWAGDPDRVLEAARTGRGPRSNHEIRVYVQNELFVRDKLRFDDGDDSTGSAHPEKLPGFYASLLLRVGN